MSCSVISLNLRTSSGDKHIAPLYPQQQRVLPDGGTGAAACAAALIVHVGGGDIPRPHEGSDDSSEDRPGLRSQNALGLRSQYVLLSHGGLCNANRCSDDSSDEVVGLYNCDASDVCM